MAQERGGDGSEGGDGLRRDCRGGLLQSESRSDSAGRQTGFLIGEPIGLELLATPAPARRVRKIALTLMPSSVASQGDFARPPDCSRGEELEEMFDNAVGRLLHEVVAGRKRLRIDEVARELAPHRRIFLGWRRSSRSPQYQQGHADLAVLGGRIHLEI